jgi:hypothetical protein
MQRALVGRSLSYMQEGVLNAGVAHIRGRLWQAESEVRKSAVRVVFLRVSRDDLSRMNAPGTDQCRVE